MKKMLIHSIYLTEQLSLGSSSFYCVEAGARGVDYVVTLYIDKIQINIINNPVFSFRFFYVFLASGESAFRI